jgi:hypothetical protein
MITPTEVRVIDDRRLDLLAASASARLVRSTNQPAPAAAASRKSARVRAAIRHAVASLAALVAVA